MSRFRGSPSRSPFRSPARLYDTEREAIIEDQIRYKSAVRAESDARRINDELAMLQVKVRQTQDLQARIESLVRQNSQLSRDNDQLARELNQRRYELERLRSSANDHADRDAMKMNQLYEANKSLELQIELLKKERLESNRLYEAHIEKLERMLDDKVLELDSTTLRCNDLSKELELNVIRFEEEKNRLKNLMNRTEHQLERELEYTKQKTITEKFSEMDALKKNHAAQILLLEDEISKLKYLNSVKTDEFESQLAENRNLRKRHDEQVRALGAENDELRGRMLKLEQINRSEVENIQNKYSDYHNQGTNSMKEQHGRQIKLLLDQIDKLKWLTQEKNTEIQNLVQDKRDLRRHMDDNQLQLGSEIDSLKNKLYSQQEKNAADTHALMARINDLCDKSLRESEGYHQRAKDFMKKISVLEEEINNKQNNIDKINRQNEIRTKQFERKINQANSQIEKLRRELQDSEQELKSAENRHQEYKSRAEKEINDISHKLSEVEATLEETEGKLARLHEESSGNDELLKTEIDSLRKTVNVLEEKLSSEQERHASEMKDLYENINEKVKRLQSAQKKALSELQNSKQQQLNALNLRVEKSNRDRASAEEELKKYINMYEDMEKYFKNPHDGALFDEKSKDSIYQVLSKISHSSIHIF